AFFCFVHEKDTGSYRNSNFSKSCDRFYATLMLKRDLLRLLPATSAPQVPQRDLFRLLPATLAPQVLKRDLIGLLPATLAPQVLKRDLF
ncbi:hypothetical protein, partial [Paenibacillus lactis]|uniref:hypothetical protein n=1 Tax=Paenibacillus lactis TaxID=228574 RepID=UPI0036C79FA5